MTDWYTKTGAPSTGAQGSSATMRNEFAAIESSISSKLPTLTGNGTKIIAVNSGGTALEAINNITVPQGGTGASSLTDGGILLGSGTGAITPMAVLLDGQIVIGDGVSDPIALSAFTSSAGTLKHEYGGLEANISGVVDGDFIVGTGAGTVGLESGATVRVTMGLGSIATQNSNAITVTGGSATNLTSLSTSNFSVNVTTPGTAQASSAVTTDANIDVIGLRNVTAASFINSISTSRVNDIINGKHRIAQIGTSFVNPITGFYDLDGWQISYSNAAVRTVSREAGSSTGKYARKVVYTSYDTAIGVTEYEFQYTRVEGYNCVKYLGNTFTLGFRVKATATGIHCVSFYDGTNSYIVEYTINTTNTWEYKTITVTNGFTTLANTTSDAGFFVRWINAAGTGFHAAANTWVAGDYLSTSNQVSDISTLNSEFWLEDVSINLGTSVAYDDTSYADELRRCERYFEVVADTTGGYSVQLMGVRDAFYYNMPLRFRTPKRNTSYSLQRTDQGVLTGLSTGLGAGNFSASNFNTSSAITCTAGTGALDLGVNGIYNTSIRFTGTALSGTSGDIAAPDDFIVGTQVAIYNRL